MERHNLLSYGQLNEKKIEEWIKKRQENAESREKALKQLEEDERLAEKQSRKRVIVLTETVMQLLE